jgi:hypothetical protein
MEKSSTTMQIDPHSKVSISRWWGVNGTAAAGAAAEAVSVCMLYPEEVWAERGLDPAPDPAIPEN